MMRALIVGCQGQDGRILWDQLAARGFSLVGISRREMRTHEAEWREPVDLGDASAVHRVIERFRPDQIYYLAAFHHSSQDQPIPDGELWTKSYGVHVQGFLHVLAAAADVCPSTRIFYASSSRIFGQALQCPQTEETPIRPICLYGVTKATGMMLAAYYRQQHRLHVACGILFNHESPLRGPQFLSQRVVEGLVALKLGRIAELQIGRLDTRVDWGYAPDYTRAMQLLLETDSAGDFVIASGETHTVQEMIETAAAAIGVNWRGHIVENASILGRDPLLLCGNPTRLHQATGWKPSVDFRGMVRIMAEAALARSTIRA